MPSSGPPQFRKREPMKVLGHVDAQRPLKPVIKIIASNADCEPFICKIDIEGAESELFSKNTEWLSRFPVVIIELHDWRFAGEAPSRNFIRTIAHLDRDFVLLGESVWSIANRLGRRGDDALAVAWH
jgi:hypothetical protein